MELFVDLQYNHYIMTFLTFNLIVLYGLLLAGVSVFGFAPSQQLAAKLDHFNGRSSMQMSASHDKKNVAVILLAVSFLPTKPIVFILAEIVMLVCQCLCRVVKAKE